MHIDHLIIAVPLPVKEPPDKRLLQLDLSSKPVSGRSWPWKKRSCYLVSVAHDRLHPHVALREKLKVTATPADSAQGRPVELEISYAAWCLPPHAEKFAVHYDQELLAKPGFRLGETLDDALRRSANERLNALPKGCTDISALEKALAADLRAAYPELEFNVGVQTNAPVETEWEAPDPPVIELKFEDHRDPIKMQTKVLRLRLIDLRQYLFHHHHSDLNAWARWAITDAARTEVESKSKSYTEFISGWNDLREAIKQRVTHLAAQIGYEVVALLNEPNTKEYDALRGLKVDIEDRVFRPKDAELSIKLSLHVSGRLRDLNQPPVRAAVSGGVEIERRLKESIETAVQTYLHTVSADSFYLNYLTIEAAILNQVRGVLDSFGVIGDGADSNARITIKQGHSEITAIAAELQRAPISIRDLEVPIVGTGHVAKYNFTFVVKQFKADEVEAYARLARLGQRGDAVAVRRVIEDAIREKLLGKISTLGVSNVHYQSPGAHRELETGIDGLIRHFAAQEFGLEIHLQNLRRLSTLDELHEQKANEMRRNFQLGTTEQSLEKLKIGRAALLDGYIEKTNDSSRDDTEREEVLEKVEKFANEKAPPPAVSGTAEVKILEALLGHLAKPALENKTPDPALPDPSRPPSPVPSNDSV